MKASIKNFAFPVIALMGAFVLQSCSLTQRQASNSIRISLNSKSASGSPSRLADIAGVPPITSNSYYVINVEGEGIQRSSKDGASCVGLSESSSIIVPAMGPQNASIELLVPTGMNRSVRLFRFDFAPDRLNGYQMPTSGVLATPFLKQYNPEALFEPLLLAEAFIPELNGDQTIVLMEKPVAMVMNCMGGQEHQAPIENADLRMMDYGPWFGQTGGIPNAIGIWGNSDSDFYLRTRGRLKNKLSNTLSYFTGGFGSSSTPALSVSQVGSIDMGGGTTANMLPGNQERYFRQGVKISKSSLAGSKSLTQGMSYSGGNNGVLERTIKFNHLGSSPVSVGEPQKIPGSLNLYAVKIQANQAASVRMLRPDSIFTAYGALNYSPSPGVRAEVEAVSVPGNFVSTIITGLSSPQGVALDSDGRIYVADTLNNKIKIYEQSSFATPLFILEAPIDAPLSGPGGIAVDKDRNVYVADTNGGSGFGRILKFPFVSGGYPTASLIELGTGFSNPEGVAVDASGNVFVADTGNSQIKKILAGSGAVQTIPCPELIHPQGLTLDPEGNIYVAETGSDKVVKLSSSGSVIQTWSLVAGSNPQAVVLGKGGDIFVANTWKYKIQKLSPDGTITDYAGSGSAAPNTVDRFSADADLWYPSGLAIDPSGNLFIADDGSGSIRKISVTCPFSANQYEVPPLELGSNGSCLAYYAVLNAGALTGGGDSVIVDVEVSDAQNRSGIVQHLLSDSSNPSLYSYTATQIFTNRSSNLVYNSNGSGTLSVSRAYASDPLRGSFFWQSYLSNSTPKVVRSEIRSDGGNDQFTDNVTLHMDSVGGLWGISSMETPRHVKAQMVRSASVVVSGLDTSNNLFYQKQELDFSPIDPSLAQVRLSFNGSSYAAGASFLYAIDTNYSSNQIFVQYGGSGMLLPGTAEISGTCGVTSNSALDLGGAFNFGCSSSSSSITAVAHLSAIDDISLSSSTWSGSDPSAISNDPVTVGFGPPESAVSDATATARTRASP